jgi:peptidoglycan hydrolase CwlO-like protein
MNLKLIVAILAIAAVPVCALAQKPGAAKVTKADAQKVVKLISADKAKTQTYCDIAKLGDQIEQADQKKDNKKIDELSKKMDEMSQKLGPEYVALMDGLQDMDPNSKEGEDIGLTLEALDKLCAK